jgi:hypothetical protein
MEKSIVVTKDMTKTTAGNSKLVGVNQMNTDVATDNASLTISFMMTQVFLTVSMKQMNPLNFPVSLTFAKHMNQR